MKIPGPISQHRSCAAADLIITQNILLSNVFLTTLDSIKASDPAVIKLLKRAREIQKRFGVIKPQSGELLERAFSLQSLMVGRGEYVDLMSYFLISELFRDFYALVLSGLGSREKSGVEKLMLEGWKNERRLGREISRVLSRIAKRDEASMMSLWGRRIIGDVLLFIKLCLGCDYQDSRAILSTLAGKHSERMRSIGLIA